MKGGGSRIPLLFTALAVLVLLGVVTVASTGSTPTGTSDGRRPSDLILDTFFSLALVALIPAAAIFIWALTQRRAIAQEIASGRYPRTSAVAFIVFVALFTVAVTVAQRRGGLFQWGDLGETVEVGPDGQVTIRDASEGDPDAYQAEFAWIPVLVVVGLVALAVGAYLLAVRSRAPLVDEEGFVAEELADVLDETLDDLLAEPDARKAVIAAWARLERSLAAAGFPRKRHETAEEYVARVLGLLTVDERPVQALTGLYERAKFSQHAVDDRMRHDAVDALAAIRDDLRRPAERPAEPEPAPAGEAATP